MRACNFSRGSDNLLQLDNFLVSDSLLSGNYLSSANKQRSTVLPNLSSQNKTSNTRHYQNMADRQDRPDDDPHSPITSNEATRATLYEGPIQDLDDLVDVASILKNDILRDCTPLEDNEASESENRCPEDTTPEQRDNCVRLEATMKQILKSFKESKLALEQLQYRLISADETLDALVETLTQMIALLKSRLKEKWAFHNHSETLAMYYGEEIHCAQTRLSNLKWQVSIKAVVAQVRNRTPWLYEHFEGVGGHYDMPPILGDIADPIEYARSSIPSYTVQSFESDKECHICSQRFPRSKADENSEASQPRWTEPVTHATCKFTACSDCIVKWFGASALTLSCPMCRKPFTKHEALLIFGVETMRWLHELRTFDQ